MSSTSLVICCTKDQILGLLPKVGKFLDLGLNNCGGGKHLFDVVISDGKGGLNHFPPLIHLNPVWLEFL